MYWLFLLLFIVLLIVNLIYSRSLLTPGSLFCAVWAGCFAGLIVIGDRLYRISLETLLIYFIGALCLSAGALFVLLGPPAVPARKTPSPARVRQTRVILDILLVFCLLTLPAYVALMWGLARGAPAKLALQAIRQASVAGGLESAPLDPIRNLTVVAVLVALAMQIENDGTLKRRLRVWLAFGVAAAAGVLSGSKAPAVILIIQMPVVSWLAARAISWKKLVYAFGAGCTLFVVGLLTTNFASSRFGGPADGARIILKTLVSYSFGGLVAFDRIARDPGVIESNHRLDRFFLETARSLGYDVYVPSVHALFSPISTDPEFFPINTYTLYFTYFKDGGWPQMMVCTALLGMLLAWVYRYAIQGYPLAIFAYSGFAIGILFSMSSEHFALGLNGSLKGLLFFLLVYHLPVFRSGLSRGRQELGWRPLSAGLSD